MKPMGDQPASDANMRQVTLPVLTTVETQALSPFQRGNFMQMYND